MTQTCCPSNTAGTHAQNCPCRPQPQIVFVPVYVPVPQPASPYAQGVPYWCIYPPVDPLAPPYTFTVTVADGCEVTPLGGR